jgi:hypothetical protein
VQQPRWTSAGGCRQSDVSHLQLKVCSLDEMTMKAKVEQMLTCSDGGESQSYQVWNTGFSKQSMRLLTVFVTVAHL